MSEHIIVIDEKVTKSPNELPIHMVSDLASGFPVTLGPYDGYEARQFGTSYGRMEFQTQDGIRGSVIAYRLDDKTTLGVNLYGLTQSNLLQLALTHEGQTYYALYPAQPTDTRSRRVGKQAYFGALQWSDGQDTVSYGLPISNIKGARIAITRGTSS